MLLQMHRLTCNSHVSKYKDKLKFGFCTKFLYGEYVTALKSRIFTWKHKPPDAWQKLYYMENYGKQLHIHVLTSLKLRQ